MQKIKKILLIVSVLVMTSAQTVLAQEGTVDLLEKKDTIKKGSVQIILPDSENDYEKKGIEFQCIKVADIKNGSYLFSDEIQLKKKIEFKDEMTAKQLDEMAGLLSEQEYDAEVKKTDSTGNVMFEDLEPGVYLVKAKDAKSYGSISSALIAVPTWDEVQLQMEYNVKVIPKYSKEVQQGVKTGDSLDLTEYLGAAGIALLAIGYLGKRRKIYDRQ